MSSFGVSNDGLGTNAEQRQTVLSSFRKRRLRVDWRAIATLDLERLVRDVDVKSLQENVMNVAFCDIEREDFSIDSNFLKIFKLAQLIIEYVLYCQQQLEVQVGNSRKQLDELRKTESELRQQVTTLQQEVTAVRRENRKRRKMLEAAQSLMNAGANGYHRCSMCLKAFVSDAFLQSHMQRRHGEQISVTLADGMMQQHSDRLKQAVEAARQEALESSREQYQVELQNALREMQERMDTVTHELRSEMSHKEAAAVQAREADLAEWRKAEEQRRQREMAALEQKIQLLERDKADAQQEVAELRSQQAKRSNLGDLEDDDNVGGQRQSQRIKQQELLLLQQREEHQNEIGQVRTEFAEEMRKQERKWKKRFQDMTKNHQLELEQASSRMTSVERELHESQKQWVDTHLKDNNPYEQDSGRSSRQTDRVSEKAFVVRADEVEHQTEVTFLDSLSQLAASGRRDNVSETKSSSRQGAFDHVKPLTKAQPVLDVSETTEESDDDIDVSSYAGSVSKDLAESIKRSRQASLPTNQLVQIRDTPPEMLKKMEAVNGKGRELSEDEEEVDDASPGEYTPFETHPEIKTQYKHSAVALENQRAEVMNLLNTELQRKGIIPEAERLTLPQFNDKMAALERERDTLSKRHRNVFEIRRKKESEIAEIVRTAYKPALSESARKPPRVPKGSQGVRSSNIISSQLPARPPAPAPTMTTPVVLKDSRTTNGTMYDNESDEESDSLTETATESVTTSPSPEQLRRTASRPVASSSSGTVTTRSPPTIPQPYTSTPAQSGSSLASGVQGLVPGSGHTIQSEYALVTRVPSQLAGQKEETSWDSEGSTLSESERDEPNRRKPSNHHVSAFVSRSLSPQTVEVPMRQDAGTPKHGTGKVAALANRLSASMSLSPDPSKRPKGGVSMFGGPAVDRGVAGTLDDDEDFSNVTEIDDFSETRSGVATGQLSSEVKDLRTLVNSPPAGLRPPVKVPSSVVASFNQGDDFSDLDDDDLETTNLQH